jgi:hypothetical protein
MNNNGQLCETTPDTHISQVRGSTLTPLIEGMGGDDYEMFKSVASGGSGFACF